MKIYNLLVNLLTKVIGHWKNLANFIYDAACQTQLSHSYLQFAYSLIDDGKGFKIKRTYWGDGKGNNHLSLKGRGGVGGLW